MEKSTDLSKTDCLNCGASITGNFCHNCGQHVRDNSDRSLSRLVEDFLANTFFLENQFFLSVWYLFRYPGRMTVVFLNGKRKKFVSPVTLFLFFNLVYFLVNPLSDYSLTLEDQIYSQPYSDLIRDWVADKLKTESLERSAYALTYQNMSDTISKSIMILNVPIVAFFVYFMASKKRKFYFDSLIFAFHYFSFFIFSWVMLAWVDSVLHILPESLSSAGLSISFDVFANIIPLLYAIFSIKKFMGIRWYWAIPAGLGIFASVFLANLVYRFIIFIITFWAT